MQKYVAEPPTYGPCFHTFMTDVLGQLDDARQAKRRANEVLVWPPEGESNSGYTMRVTPTMRNALLADVKTFTKNLIINIESRFPDDELLASFDVFNPQQYPRVPECAKDASTRDINKAAEKETRRKTWTVDRMTILAEKYGTPVEIDGESYGPLVNKQQLMLQWDVLYQ